MLFNNDFDCSKFLNHILDDINLYNKITETSSNKNKKVKIVLTINKNGNSSSKLLMENK